MSDSHSDAFVFFGATGDLAYKKIFPALQAMVKRGNLNVPVVGVARSDWNVDQFRARAYDSLDKHGGVDRVAFDKLCGLLRYVGGDLQRPHYLQRHSARARFLRAPSALPCHPPSAVRAGCGATREIELCQRRAGHY